MKRILSILAVALVCSGSASAGAAASPQSLLGNGWVPNEVSLSHGFFMGAHNAPFSRERGWLYAQQQCIIPAQLAAGIRLMKTPIRYFVRWDHMAGEPKEAPTLVLSHEGFFKERNSLTSHLQKGTLGNPTDSALDFMVELKTFLEATNEILILILETHNMIPSEHTCTQDKTEADMQADLVSLLTKSGLDRFAHKLNLGADGLYPTFGDLRSTGKRIIIFSSHDAYNLDTPLTNTTRRYAESDYTHYGEHDTGLRKKAASSKGQGTERFFVMNNIHPASCWRTCFYEWLNGYDHLAKRIANFRGVRPQTDAEGVFIPTDGYLPNAVKLDFAQIGEGALLTEAVQLDYIKTFYPGLLTPVMQGRLHAIGETRMSMLQPLAGRAPVELAEPERDLRVSLTPQDIALAVFGPHVLLDGSLLDKACGTNGKGNHKLIASWLEMRRERYLEPQLCSPEKKIYVDNNTRRNLIEMFGTSFQQTSKALITEAFIGALQGVPSATPMNDLMLAYGRILVQFLSQLHLFGGTDDALAMLCREFALRSGKSRTDLLAEFNVVMNRAGAVLTTSTPLTEIELRKAYDTQLARRCFLAALYDGQTSPNITIQSPELREAMIEFFGLKVGRSAVDSYDSPLEGVMPNDPFLLIENGVATVSFLQLLETSVGATTQGFKVGGAPKGVIALKLSKPDATDPYPGGRLTIAAGDVNPSRSVSGWAGSLVGAVSGPDLSKTAVPAMFQANLREPGNLILVHIEAAAAETASGD